MTRDDYFSTYDVYSENEIKTISAGKIELTLGKDIFWDECRNNFAQYFDPKATRCVGERDITDYSFTFYCSPHPIMIKFFKRNLFSEFFSRPIHQRFADFQKKINELGYTTFDMS